MANKKIIELDAASQVNSDALFPLSQLVDSNQKTLKATLAQMQAAMLAPVSGLVTLGESSGSIASFSTDISDKLFSCYVNVTAKQAGSGTPAPDNVRAISGWSGAKVSSTGKNLFSPQGLLDNGATESGDVYSFSQIPMDRMVLTLNTTEQVTLTYKGKTNTQNTNGYIAIVYSDGTASRDVSQHTANEWYSVSITSTSGKTVIGLKVTAYASINQTDFKEMQLELGTSATTYEPFGTTHNIPFNTTVYGGVLDVLSGVLTVTEKYFTFSSALLYGNYGDDNKPLYYVAIPDYSTDKIKNMPIMGFEGVLLSNIASKISVGAENSMQNNEMRTNNAMAPSRFYFRADSFADLTALNTFLSSTPLQVVASLQEPTTIQLTPTEIKTILGQNNIFGDCGDIDLKYLETIGNRL